MLRFAHTEEIFSVFLRTFGRSFGKHAVKHKDADRERNAVQNEADGIVFDEYRKYRHHEINDEQTARKLVGAVSAAEKRR